MPVFPRLKRLVRIAGMAVVVAAMTAGAFLAGFATHRLSQIEVSQALSAGDLRAPVPPDRAPGEPPEFDVFWEAWDLIQSQFYGDLPSGQDMVHGAIRGAIGTLDDAHTVFVDPRQSELFEESLNGSFEGIGATIEKRDDRIVIVAPLANTPADRAGLRSGDVIVEVDGRSLLGAELWEAVAQIRGPRGTTVTLTIARPGRVEPFDVTVRRARIEIPVLEARIIRENDVSLAYVKLFHFSNNAPRRLRSELRRLLSDDPQGLILDLRGNPGGYLHVAVEVASQFIGEGLVLIERGQDRARRHPAQPGGLLAGSDSIPLVVLVDEGSASASEIVAGAVQDHDRGVLIGERTFGKGSVQISRDLSDGSSLRITTARWLTPAGRQIHGRGLTPDVVVRGDAEARAGVDLQLDRSVRFLVQQVTDRSTGAGNHD